MRIGLVLRCFEKDPTKVNARVAEVIETLRTMEQVVSTSSFEYKHCLVLVPRSREFKDYDCGLTASSLRASVQSSGLKCPGSVAVEETDLDIFACAVNHAAVYLSNHGCDRMLIVSTSCRSYVTRSNMEVLVRAFDRGAKVSGLIIADDPKIMGLQRNGSLMNTFALWDIRSFQTVGGMNPAEGNPRVDQSKNRYVQTKNGRVVFAGLETTTLYHLGMTFGRCIAPVVPVDQGVWQAPDPLEDPVGADRERLKRESKVDRHHACFHMEGYNWQELRKFLLPGYPI